MLILLLLIFVSCGNNSSKVSGLVDQGLGSGITPIEILITNKELIPPTDGIYGEGSILIFQLVFDEEITVQGDPLIKININSQTREAKFVSGSGSNTLEFQYIVTNQDQDNNGIEFNPVLKMNGASLTNVDGVSIDDNLLTMTTSLINVLIDVNTQPAEKINNIVTAPSSKDRSLNISWNKPINNGPAIINYSVQYRKKGDQLWLEINPRPTSNNTEISDLDYNTDYEVRVSTNNGVISSYSDIMDVFIFDLMSLSPIAWLDATDPNGDGILPGDGSLISEWVDKTGIASSAIESDVSKQPVIEYNAFNGLPAIRFDNLDRGLEGTFPRSNGTSLTIFIVGQFDSGNSDKCMFEFINGSSRAFFIDRRYAGNNYYTATKGSLNLWTVENQGNFATVNENSLDELYSGNLTFNTDFVGTGNYVLGDDATGGNRLNGYIAEILIFDGQLSIEDITLIESYLLNKWGL